MPLSPLFHGNKQSHDFHNVIKTSSDFLNREEDIKTLKDYLLVNRFRLICISGEAGIGKTETAKKLANEIIKDTTDFHSVVWTSAKEMELKPARKDSSKISSFNRKSLSESKGVYAANIEKLFEIILKISMGNPDYVRKKRFFFNRKKNIREEEILNHLKIRKTLIIIDDLDSWNNWEEVLTFARRIPYPSAILITTRRSLLGTIPGLASHRLNLLESNHIKTVVEKELEKKSLVLEDWAVETIVAFAKGNPLYAKLACGFTKVLEGTDPVKNLLMAFMTKKNYEETISEIFYDLHLHLTHLAKDVLLCLCLLKDESKNADLKALDKILAIGKKAIDYSIYELEYSSLINRNIKDDDPYDVHDLIKQFVFNMDEPKTRGLRTKIKNVL